MLITDIVARINQKLAGERHTYTELKMYMDAVIDDINTRLNSTYPAFSELTLDISNYNYFPDRWIRMVVIPGAAAKYFVTDEEGIDAAPAYAMEYDQNLFLMTRDFFSQVPDIYRTVLESREGTVDFPETEGGLEIDGAYFNS